MKAILILSITCMVASGIFGFADFANDLNNGTLVKYDEGETVVKQTATKANSISERPQINKLRKTSQSAPEETNSDKKANESTSENESAESTINTDKIQLKYFSRGRPYIEEAIVEPEPDSNLTEGVTQLPSSENSSLEIPK